jgi:hypothetical protein
MFTMRDYLVEAQRREDEIARAQHHNLVRSVSLRRGRQVGRLLIRLGERLIQEGRSLQGCAVEAGRSSLSAGHAGASIA